MATTDKPWKAEYAKSATATCNTCNNKIGIETLRLGRMIRARDFDNLRPVWHHATCIMRKANRINSVDEIEGIGLLRWEDLQNIRKYVDSTRLASDTVATAPAPAPAPYGIEASPTSRATCKHCSKKIMKVEVRISAKIDGQGARSLTWYHAICFLESFPSTLLDSLSGWESLSSAHQACVQDAAKGLNSSGKSVMDSETGGKRKGDNGGSDEKLAKKVKLCTDKCGSPTNAMDCGVEEAAFESKLEAQIRAFWDLKDNLKKYVSSKELRLMLEANDQRTSGSELDRRERCADGMMFGALKSCPVCSGQLSCSGSTYKCHGHISGWTRCSHSTTLPERDAGKWKIPEKPDNQYLVKWFKSQAAAKPVRILYPSTSNVSAGNQLAQGQLKDENLGCLRVAITGLPKETVEEFRTKIEGAGGQVHTKIKKGTNCLVVSAGLSEQNAELKSARSMKIPIVREEYLFNCIKD